MAAYYPPSGFHFKIEFNLQENESDNRFQEVGGLSVDVNTEDLKEGGLNEYVHKLPTGVKYGNLSLKRGLLLDSKIIDWIQDAVNNFDFAPTDINVVLLNEKHEPLASWTFTGAYPIKWSVSDFKAMDSGYIVESLELAYRKFRKN